MLHQRLHATSKAFFFSHLHAYRLAATLSPPVKHVYFGFAESTRGLGEPSIWKASPSLIRAEDTSTPLVVSIY